MLAARTTRPVAAGTGIRAAAPRRRAAVVANASMKLYTHPRSRGRIVEWYIQELGLSDVELVNMDLSPEKKEHKSPEFLKVNPFGKVPALTDGDLALFESGALLTYIADKAGQLPTPEARAKAAQWVLFANCTLANALFVEQLREKAMPDVLGSLEAVLSGKEFLEGGTFTVSDVAVGAYLLYVPVFLPQVDMSPYPNIQRFMAAMAARPACAATVAARVEEATKAAPAAAEKK